MKISNSLVKLHYYYNFIKKSPKFIPINIYPLHGVVILSIPNYYYFFQYIYIIN